MFNILVKIVVIAKSILFSYGVSKISSEAKGAGINGGFVEGIAAVCTTLYKGPEKGISKIIGKEVGQTVKETMNELMADTYDEPTSFSQTTSRFFGIGAYVAFGGGTLGIVSSSVALNLSEPLVRKAQHKYYSDYYQALDKEANEQGVEQLEVYGYGSPGEFNTF